MIKDKPMTQSAVHTSCTKQKVEGSSYPPCIPEGESFHMIDDSSEKVENNIARNQTAEEVVSNREEETGPLLMSKGQSSKFSTLIKMNLFIGFRFILALYIWFNELTTPVPDPYRYFSWYHSVSGLPTSFLIIIWKMYELWLRKERGWPYSVLLSLVALSGSIVFLTSGILATYEYKDYVDNRNYSSPAIRCFMVGLGIIFCANVLETLIGVLSIVTQKSKIGSNRSFRTVAASMLQAGAFACLILDFFKKVEIYRSVSALIFVVEGIVLTRSKLSTETTFLYWNSVFKIIGSITFLVSAGTFEKIIKLNETYWTFPSFFPIERGLVMPFYVLLVCLWFDVDYLSAKHTRFRVLAGIFLLLGALPTGLVLYWIASTKTANFRSTPTLMVSSSLLCTLALARLISVTAKYFKAKKGLSMDPEQKDMRSEEGKALVVPSRREEEESVSFKQHRTNHEDATQYSPNIDTKEIISTVDSCRSIDSSDSDQAYLSVFGPVGDFFRFFASVITVYLSFYLYFEVGKKKGQDHGNQLMLFCIGIGTIYLLHSICWIKVRLNIGHNDSSKQGKYTMPEDTYTLMMFNRPFSQPWLLGLAVFALQATLTVMVLFAEIQSREEFDNLLHAPYNVNMNTRIGQVAGMVIILLYQSDYWTASTILEIRFLGAGKVEGMAILFPATIRFTQSIGVVVASTILILQSDDIIDLVKDYTAILFISEIDDFVFGLADNGYLGPDLEQGAEDVKDKEVQNAPEHPIRSIGFITIFGLMMASWVYVMNNQVDGAFFKQEHPECFDKVGGNRIQPLKFGDGRCDLVLNHKECEFDGGDCLVENVIHEADVVFDYPDCDVKYKAYIGEFIFFYRCIYYLALSPLLVLFICMLLTAFV